MTRPHISNVTRDGRQRTLAVIDGELNTLPMRFELAFPVREAACPYCSRKEKALVTSDFSRTEFEPPHRRNHRANCRQNRTQIIAQWSNPKSVARVQKVEPAMNHARIPTDFPQMVGLLQSGSGSQFDNVFSRQ
jgi:hypothetical protein